MKRGMRGREEREDEGMGSSLVLGFGVTFICSGLHNDFLSAQCISSIGQIIKSVCVSVSQSVSQ